jgi:hypothetical protein
MARDVKAAREALINPFSRGCGLAYARPVSGWDRSVGDLSAKAGAT